MVRTPHSAFDWPFADNILSGSNCPVLLKIILQFFRCAKQVWNVNRANATNSILFFHNISGHSFDLSPNTELQYLKYTAVFSAIGAIASPCLLAHTTVVLFQFSLFVRFHYDVETFPCNSLLITTPHELMFTKIPAIDGPAIEWHSRENGRVLNIWRCTRKSARPVAETARIPGPKLSPHVIGTKRKTRTVSPIPGGNRIPIFVRTDFIRTQIHVSWRRRSHRSASWRVYEYKWLRTNISTPCLFIFLLLLRRPPGLFPPLPSEPGLSSKCHLSTRCYPLPVLRTDN